MPKTLAYFFSGTRCIRVLNLPKRQRPRHLLALSSYHKCCQCITTVVGCWRHWAPNCVYSTCLLLLLKRTTFMTISQIIVTNFQMIRHVSWYVVLFIVYVVLFTDKCTTASWAVGDSADKNDGCILHEDDEDEKSWRWHGRSDDSDLCVLSVVASHRQQEIQPTTHSPITSLLVFVNIVHVLLM